MSTFEETLKAANIKKVVILGCSGAIGNALVETLISRFPEASVYGFSRTSHSHSFSEKLDRYQEARIDYEDEESIAKCAALAAETGPLDLVIVATGILHQGGLMPEKSLRDLSAEKMMALYQANCITPTLLAKHFIPQLSKKSASVFAALSARVGSISDNALGGWYAYRASKSALNMVIKNAGIETARRNKSAIIVGLHPGTVDSDLSKPFQANVPAGKLFRPLDSANYLLETLLELTPSQTGKCFAWDGQEIAP
ncbi:MULTISPECIES: SDR family NAD(P)-dependent oxidoreductase [unclassified Marinomonas]|uniref:SDR family NAD(P)-dependent oxidoreductase n=1 Tax=unclassified Marinomonas TaxID=196814 RepID=UPI0007AF8405|nr:MULTISPECIES: SDR family NAD(P)-dependent oxidoreductase [unclassified Marinomonas]